MAPVRALVVGALAGHCFGESQGNGNALTVNPIRRVVTMLQQMSNKVVAEGKKEQVLFDKFMCYCKTGVDDLKDGIQNADTKIPEVESALKKAEAEKAQLEQDTKKAQETRRECKEAIATATSLREKEAAAYAKASGDLKANTGAMKKAIASLESAGFLQTSNAQVVKRLSVELELSPADRDQVVNFLSSGSTSNSESSGQITGILKQMLDTMTSDLNDLTAKEEEAIANYDSLVKAKEQEIQAATQAVEDKLTRVGDLGVEIATMKEDLDDTGKQLIEDKKFLAELEKSCSTKEAEWDERCKLRNEELLALGDTIKMLNDDDALELFKKTLPSASLLQVQESSKSRRNQALAILNTGSSDYRMDLISLSIRGKKVNFDKVISMVDDMVVLLKKEQGDDDDKKEMCEMQLDKAEDDLKLLETTISDLEKAVEESKENLATLVDEIAALKKGIEDLDKQVEDATVNRREENEDYTNLMASNTAAKELIEMAKNRMNKFYNPAMYKEPASFIQIHMHAVDAPPPPPETFGKYSKKSEESNGVLAMMDTMIADLDKEMQEAELEEKDGQQEYEEFMRDAAEKRVLDSKSITEKEATKADEEMSIEKNTQERHSKMKTAVATVTVIEDLHKECDWLLKNYGVRKDARAGEIDALKKAKAVLSGADFS